MLYTVACEKRCGLKSTRGGCSLPVATNEQSAKCTFSSSLREFVWGVSCSISLVFRLMCCLLSEGVRITACAYNRLPPPSHRCGLCCWPIVPARACLTTYEYHLGGRLVDYRSGRPDVARELCNFIYSTPTVQFEAEPTRSQ